MLKKYLRKRALARNIPQNREVKYISLSDARKIGVIMDVKDTGAIKAFKLLKAIFEENSIEYKFLILDFVNDITPIKEIDSDTNVRRIHKSVSNWYGVPKLPSIEKFIEERFNILLDLTTDNKSFTLDYIVRVSNASLKIGSDSRFIYRYDIVIDNGASHKLEISAHIQSTIDYLTTIKENISDNT